MAKFFEAAGAGCCPVADAIDDLDALGFRHGENAILFRAHAELVDELCWWLARPERLRTLGRAASAHAHKEHTWAHRAQALRAAIMLRLSQHGS